MQLLRLSLNPHSAPFYSSFVSQAEVRRRRVFRRKTSLKLLVFDHSMCAGCGAKYSVGAKAFFAGGMPGMRAEFGGGRNFVRLETQWLSSGARTVFFVQARKRCVATAACTSRYPVICQSGPALELSSSLPEAKHDVVQSCALLRKPYFLDYMQRCLAEWSCRPSSLARSRRFFLFDFASRPSIGQGLNLCNMC